MGYVMALNPELKTIRLRVYRKSLRKKVMDLKQEDLLESQNRVEEMAEGATSYWGAAFVKLKG